jgi:Carbohydrate binding domain
MNNFKSVKKPSSAYMRTIMVQTFLIVFFANVVNAQNFTWSIGAPTSVSQFNSVDSNPGIVKDGNDLWMLYGNQGPEWHRFKGTTMDNLVQQVDGWKDASFTKPHGDDRYWCKGLWIDPSSGKWYTTVHVEFNYNKGNNGGDNGSFDWFRKIGLATSTDKGASWHYEGDIITSDNPTDSGNSFPGEYYDWGCGDQSLFVDNNYIYVYYMHSWVKKSNGARIQQIRVARCPISSKMAPGQFTKWYNGGWSTPALGGRDSDIFTNADSGVIFYSSYLNKYVCLGVNTSSQGAGYISTCTDMNIQNWTEPVKFSEYDPNTGWYNWPVDPSTWSTNTIGQQFRYYGSRVGVGGFTSRYRIVTFGSGSTTPVTFPHEYPPQAVNDGNPNYGGGSTGQLVKNGNFELGNTTSWNSSYGTYGAVNNNQYAGNYCGYVGSNSGLEQTVTGLAANTTYTFSMRVKVATSGEVIYAGVKNYGGSEIGQSTTSNSYVSLSVTFTTGASNTSALIYLYKPSGGIGYGDDASIVTSTPLLTNGGFESGSLSPWSPWNTASISNSNQRSGSNCVSLGASTNSVEQVITGLSPNTTYVYTGYGKVVNSGEIVYLGAKNYGGSQVLNTFSTTNYTQTSVTFTTGTSNTSATLFFFKDTGNGGAFGDDFSLDIVSIVTPLLTNGGFESGSLSPWSPWNTANISNSNQRSGSNCVSLGALTNSVEQVITGLSPNTTYVYSGYGKVANSGEVVSLGAKNFGGSEISSSINTTSYAQASVTFTTGASNTNATVYFYKASGTGGAYGDDFSLTNQSVASGGRLRTEEFMVHETFESGERSFSIYPNPLTGGTLIVEFPETCSGDLIIFDVLGRFGRSVHFENVSKVELHREAFIPGLHFIKVDNGKSSKTFKLMVD